MSTFLRILAAVALPVLLLAAAELVARAERRKHCPGCGAEHPTGGRHHTDNTKGEPS